MARTTRSRRPSAGPAEPFPLEATVRALWTWRARHSGNVGRLHLERGDFSRAMDCLVKQASLCEKLPEAHDRMAAHADMVDLAIAQGSAELAAPHVGRALALAEAHALDARRLLSRIDAVVDTVAPSAALECVGAALRLARRAPEPYALACLSLARAYRSRGAARLALELLSRPLRWAEETGDPEAEIALCGEVASCLLAIGYAERAADIVTGMLRRIERRTGCPADVLALARAEVQRVTQDRDDARSGAARGRAEERS